MNHDPLAWIDEELESLERHCLRRRLAVRAGPQRPAGIRLDDQMLVNFGSNDYLGLAGEHLADAVAEAVRGAGWGSAASPLVAGRGRLHAKLEQRLAEFEGTEAALVFPSGYAANVGAITALVGSRDLILSDAKNHASIVDGCRLSRACVQVYRHGDTSHVKELLEAAGRFRRRLIVTDALFSMDGDLAPLADLADLARSYSAMLMVDEAHATGVFGRSGSGVCEQLGVAAEVHVRVGTLSKALGSIGGFVAGQRRLIQWLANRARTYVFSTALPEAAAAAGLEALRYVREEPHRRTVLLERAARLRDALKHQGWNIGASTSQIIPILIGDPARAMETAAGLQARGIFVPGIRPPSVPAGQSLLRISLCYGHTDRMIEELLDGLRAVR